MSLSFRFNRVAVVALLMTLGAAAPAMATKITTTSGFLSTFVGPNNADLDISSAEAFFRGSSFLFDATVKGPVGTTPGAFYVWGLNRGLNNAGFGAFRPGVLFDTVLILSDSGGVGSGFVVDIANGGLVTPLPGGAVTINGNNIDATAASSLFPTLPHLFKLPQYEVNLWTRVGLNPADLTQLAVFAPSNSDVPVTTPEPASAGLLGIGLVGIAGIALRRRIAIE